MDTRHVRSVFFCFNSNVCFYFLAETYQSRSRRSPSSPYPHLVSSDETPVIDDEMAEKRILEELGPKACVLEEPCVTHASRAGRAGDQPDWNDILR